MGLPSDLQPPLMLPHLVLIILQLLGLQPLCLLCCSNPGMPAVFRPILLWVPLHDLCSALSPDLCCAFFPNLCCALLLEFFCSILPELCCAFSPDLFRALLRDLCRALSTDLYCSFSPDLCCIPSSYLLCPPSSDILPDPFFRGRYFNPINQATRGETFTVYINS